MRTPPDAQAAENASLSAKTASLRLLFWIHVTIASAYMVWRIHSTLSHEYPVFGLVFYVAELFALLSSLVFYAMLCKQPRTDVAPPAAPGLSVDVFIATYDESTGLVRSTALAARDMEYPHETWICDDGNRPEIAELAEELGVGYITRPDNEHFKAGNLNHAMSRTAGAFLVVLDADHLVRADFLTSLLGYFAEDPNLAFVQIPQVYYNVDSYQHALSPGTRALWHEASIFHHRMQPGADAGGSAFFVGTGAVFRRSSLEDVGGFAESITEDIHTSIRLHSAGYQSRYVDQPLGYLLAPDTPLAYACQRLRWAQGAMQVLRTEPRLWRKGLRPFQRVTYLNSLMGYLAAYQHLIFYLAPGIFLYTGISPIRIEPELGLPIFVTYIVFSLALYKLVAGRRARLFLAECYKMLNLAIHIRGSMSLLWPSGLSFRVTPKGEHRGLPMFLIVPSVSLLLFNLTAIGAGVVQIVHGERPIGALLLASTFAAFFAAAGALAVLHAIERRGHSEAFAFPVSFPTVLTDSTGKELAVGQIRRLNHQVAYVSFDDEFSHDEVSAITLSPIGIERSLPVHQMGRQQARNLGRRSWVMKLTLGPLTADERDAIDSFVIAQALPEFFEHFATENLAAAVGGDRQHLLPEDFRYLPVRSGIV